jgi:hypothetical protein
MNNKVYWFRIRVGINNLMSVAKQMTTTQHYYQGAIDTSNLHSDCILWTVSLSPRTQAILSLSLTGYEEITMYSDTDEVMVLLGITGMSFFSSTNRSGDLSRAIKQEINNATFIS